MSNNFDRLMRKEIALAFAVVPRTVTRWRKAGMPQNPDGTYNLSSCIRWRVEQLSGDMQTDAAETEESQRYLSEYRKERAALARMDREEREGELVPVDKVKASADIAGRIVKNRLTALPARLSALVAAESDPFKCEQILKFETNQTLQDLSDEIRRQAAENQREKADS